MPASRSTTVPPDASAIHLALYALLAALPILGWALSGARGHAVSLSWTLAALVAAHATALWHHFVRKGAVLRAMWPVRLAGSRRSRPTGAHPHPSPLSDSLPVFLLDSPEVQS
jgi:cytochrome b561